MKEESGTGLLLTAEEHESPLTNKSKKSKETIGFIKPKSWQLKMEK